MKSRRTSVWWLLAGVAAAACDKPQSPVLPPPEPPKAVAVEVVQQRSIPTKIQATGTVRGRSNASITSKTIGHVRTVHVRSGDEVKAGQMLAELEASDVRAGVYRARAALSAALAQRAEAEGALVAAQVGASLAETSQRRAASLLTGQVIAQQDYDEAEAKLRGSAAQRGMAEARVASSIAEIDRARAALAEAEAQLGYTRIVAPFHGRVLERLVDAGALATPGTPLFVLAEGGALRVEAAIPESRSAAVRVGAEALVETSGIGRSVRGTVGEIVPNVELASRTFLAKIDLPESVELRPGTFVRASFDVGASSQLAVPSSAVRSLGALDRVFVVERDRALVRIVTLGSSHGGWTTVLSGLSAGDRVVRDPGPELRAGSRVVVQP